MDVWYNGDYAVSFYEYQDEKNPIGKFIGHTWKNWSLIPTARPFFVPPSRKTSELGINAINGKIDTSNLLSGYPLYNNREGSWTFFVTDYNNYCDPVLDNESEEVLDNLSEPILATVLQNFPDKYSQLLNTLHGRSVAIVLDEDPEYFYRGVVTIEEWISANNDSPNGLTIKYSVFPYKIKINPTIVDLSSALSDTSARVDISCGKMPVIPYVNTDVSGIVIWFENPEMSLSIIASRVVAVNVDTKLSAIRTCPAVMLTNTWGDNICRIRIAGYRPSTAMPEAEKVILIFREGEL